MRDFIFNFKSNSYKKGFTIIEVLIAITVIVIISGATAVLLAQSVQAENENLASTEVTLVAQSVQSLSQIRQVITFCCQF